MSEPLHVYVNADLTRSAYYYLDFWDAREGLMMRTHLPYERAEALIVIERIVVSVRAAGAVVVVHGLSEEVGIPCA